MWLRLPSLEQHSPPARIDSSQNLFLLDFPPLCIPLSFTTVSRQKGRKTQGGGEPMLGEKKKRNRYFMYGCDIHACVKFTWIWLGWADSGYTAQINMPTPATQCSVNGPSHSSSRSCVHLDHMLLWWHTGAPPMVLSKSSALSFPP